MLQKLGQIEDALTWLLEQRTAHAEHLAGSMHTLSTHGAAVLQQAHELLSFFSGHGYTAPEDISQALDKLADGVQRPAAFSDLAGRGLQLLSPERSQTDARTVEWVVNSSHGYSSTGTPAGQW